MEQKLYDFTFQAMGSPCELKIYHQNGSRAQSVYEQVVKDVRRIEQRYSRYRDDSLLTAINNVAERGGTIDIDEETFALLHYADICYQQSRGLFDITSGVLRKAWDFKTGKPPAAKNIRRLLKLVGWHKVILSPREISFSVAGMQLDLGGIGKEYAVDRAANICRQNGVVHGLVNLGGDINILGPHPDGAPWMVGVSHPRKASEVLTRIPVYKGAVASSGDYERCLMIHGKRYGHVLNPKTGWPVNGLIAVTVIAPQCVIAGSLCTISMLLEEQGKKWLKDTGVQYLWVDKNGKYQVSL